MAPYSILMFCFAGMLLLFALVVYVRGADAIPRSHMARISDKKLYGKQFAKVLALVAAAPALSAVLALLGDPDQMAFLPIIVLIAGAVAAIIIGCRVFMRRYYQIVEQEDADR